MDSYYFYFEADCPAAQQVREAAKTHGVYVHEEEHNGSVTIQAETADPKVSVAFKLSVTKATFETHE